MHPPPRRYPQSRDLPPVRACPPTQQHAQRRLWDRLLPADANPESNQVHASGPPSSVPLSREKAYASHGKHDVPNLSRIPREYRFTATRLTRSSTNWLGGCRCRTERHSSSFCDREKLIC